LIGKAIGADGDGLAKDIQAKLDAVKAITASAPKLKVFDEEDASDLTKLYTVGPGSFINDLITLAGGTNIAAAAKSAYPTISTEEVVKADPDVIVLDDALYGTTVDSVANRGDQGNQRQIRVADEDVVRHDVLVQIDRVQSGVNVRFPGRHGQPKAGRGEATANPENHV
jgi:ABC-type Fe3+-citrate transport system substrate-binding protein